VNSATLSTPDKRSNIGWAWAFYGQDQWRATEKWTINYGLRWNMAQGGHNSHDYIGAFDLTTPNPAAGGRLGALTYWGNGPGRNGRHGALRPNYFMFDPRLGLAYAPNQKTVFRSYYGIIYVPYCGMTGCGAGLPRYGSSATITPSTLDGGLTPAFNWETGVPPLPAVPNFDPSLLNGSSVQEVDYSNNKAGMVQSFGFSVERSLPHQFTIRGEYIGKMTHSRRREGQGFNAPINNLAPKYFSLGNLLLANINSPQAQAANIPIPYPGFNGSVAQALLPYPQYLSVVQNHNTGAFAEYNAGHFALEKRFSGGLSFLVDYAMTKMLVNGPYQEGMQNTQKRVSLSDRPQNLAISYTYDLPFGHGKRFLNNASGPVEKVVDGWEFVGLQNYMSGVPVSVSTQATIPGEAQVWAVRVPGVPIYAGNCSNYIPRDPSSRYLNINAFATPAQFTFGNVLTLSNVRDCTYKNENLSLVKRFELNEKTRFQFAAQFFNVFNRHYWTGLGTDINNPATFGTFSGATPPRSIQFVAKIEF
jgi:hypothetical protein